MDRREFIKGVSTGAVSIPIAGCLSLKRPNPCPTFQSQIPSNSGLLIDVHSHFFNGSDLQVGKFISQVKGRHFVDWAWLREVAGSLLQAIAWWRAPGAKDELDFLLSLQNCSEVDQADLVDIAKMSGFDNAKIETRKAFEDLAAKNQQKVILFRVIDELMDQFPATYEELYNSEQPIAIQAKNQELIYSQLGVSVGSLKQIFRFIVEMFQYRYVSAINYLNAYNLPDRKIDIVISSLVDYDWFLAKGKETRSPIPDQVRLMSEITKISRGIVNYFVPYCPLRHVAFEQGKGTFDPLELVKNAINKQGAMGVKLYPPMGFALWGNSQLQSKYPNLWKKRFLPQVAKSDNIGEQLDSCLAKFYDYCQSNDVPIMAHTSISNLSNDDFSVVYPEEEIKKLVTTKFPDLKINFGHFGGYGWDHNTAIEPLVAKKYPSIWMQLSRTIQAQQNANHDSLYVDTGFFSDVLEDKEKFKDAFKSLLTSDPYLAGKFIYGSDWKMLVTQKNVNNYLQAIESILEDPEIKPLVNLEQKEKIMGLNAVEFLGLRDGEKSRIRMEKFLYEGENAHWFKKIG